jgi:hypothetical protein
MVTGVEAAGLVLATFPLIIEGLKFYLRGLEALMRWRSYVKLVAGLILRTSLEQRKFRNTCTELFSDLVTEEELAFLLDNPGGFGSKDIQASLRERLGESLGVFSATVADTTSRLEDFKKRLDLNDVGRVSKVLTHLMLLTHHSPKPRLIHNHKLGTEILNAEALLIKQVLADMARERL